MLRGARLVTYVVTSMSPTDFEVPLRAERVGGYLSKLDLNQRACQDDTRVVCGVLEIDVAFVTGCN